MKVYFSTVVRRAPLEAGGELVRLDWETKRVLARKPLSPPEPEFEDPNPRGNGRGGRGIIKYNNLVYAATYHSLLVFDQELNQVGTVSDHLFAGLHEICWREADNSLWVASTAIDAIIGIDGQGNRIDSWWSRENHSLQQRLSLQPLIIDKKADNRTRWLNEKEQKGESHTHVNAVAFHDNEMFVLLNRYGMVFNASRDEILIEDSSLAGCHNLLFIGDHLLIGDSLGMRVVVFSAAGRKLEEVSLLDFPDVEVIYRRSIATAEKDKRTLFVRGLSPIDGLRILVGFSPATIIEIDFSTGKLLDIFQYSEDVSVCVHGLMVWL